MQERETEREKYKERRAMRGVGGVWTRRYKGRSRGGTENRKRKRGSGKRGGSEDTLTGKE